MFAVRVTDKDAVNLGDLIARQPGLRPSWEQLDPGVEEDHLASVGQLIVGDPEEAEHHQVLIVRQGPTD
jgi:hypothetical protein